MEEADCIITKFINLKKVPKSVGFGTFLLPSVCWRGVMVFGTSVTPAYSAVNRIYHGQCSVLDGAAVEIKKCAYGKCLG